MLMIPHLASFVVAMTALCLSNGEASAQIPEREPGRFALVVGDSAYEHLPRLPSSATDVLRVAEKLRALRFSVDVAKLSTVSDFEMNVLKPFASKLAAGDVAVIYFSGHGFSYGPHNWFAPLNMPASVTEGSLTDVAVSVENIGSYISQKLPALVLVLADACRAITNFRFKMSGGTTLKARAWRKMVSSPPT